MMMSELEQEEPLEFNMSVSVHRKDYNSDNITVMGLHKISLDTQYQLQLHR